MPDDSSRAETSLPGDDYERKLARKRNATFRFYKGITCVFFGFHGLSFAILLCCGLVLDRPPYTFLQTALGAAIVAWLASVALAFLQFVVALWNGLSPRWWMTALGVFPWMVIATETVVVLVAIVLG